MDSNHPIPSFENIGDVVFTLRASPASTPGFDEDDVWTSRGGGGLLQPKDEQALPTPEKPKNNTEQATTSVRNTVSL